MWSTFKNSLLVKNQTFLSHTRRKWCSTHFLSPESSKLQLRRKRQRKNGAFIWRLLVFCCILSTRWYVASGAGGSLKGNSKWNRTLLNGLKQCKMFKAPRFPDLFLFFRVLFLQQVEQGVANYISRKWLQWKSSLAISESGIHSALLRDMELSEFTIIFHGYLKTIVHF